MYNLDLFLTENYNLFDLTINNNFSDNINISKISENTYTFLSTSKKFAALKISEIITEFIICNYENNIIKKIVYSDYPYFSNKEKDNIITKTIDIIAPNDNNDLAKTLIILKRRFLIKQSILNFISENSYINLSGFIQFRLIEYKKLLSDLVEKVINDLKIQNEYNEFIAMLKFFVDTQKNRVSKLHIIFEENGEYTILNECNKNITTDCFKDFLNDSQNHSLSNEDLLISSLITLAPKKIIVHLAGNSYNKKILNTIEQIFTNKVVLNESVPNLELVTN